MEKLNFTIRCIIILAAFPVIMYTELTRDDKKPDKQKQQTAEKISSKNNEIAMISYHSPFMQAVYN